MALAGALSSGGACLSSGAKGKGLVQVTKLVPDIYSWICDLCQKKASLGAAGLLFR